MTEATIIETGVAFMSCEWHTSMQAHPISVELQAVGDLYTYGFSLSDPAEVWWEVDQVQGSASIDLTDGTGRPISGGELDRGPYTLWIEATEAPGKIDVDLYVVSEVQICHGKPVAQATTSTWYGGLNRGPVSRRQSRS